VPTVAGKTVAIVQSSYIPWKGFFDLVGRCDEYVIFDRVQFVKRHWHNRNRIPTANGPLWLTIPVTTKARFEQPIDEVAIAASWAEKHWRSLELTYRRAPCFAAVEALVRGWYEQAAREALLSRVNEIFLRGLFAYLGLHTRITRDAAYSASGEKTDRLLDLCLKAGAGRYVSGPSARAYLDEARFAAAGIEVAWMDYDGYPMYQQLQPGFDHAVSILDMLFNLGPDTVAHMKIGQTVGFVA
jgi:WbqC-like protein family